MRSTAGRIAVGAAAVVGTWLALPWPAAAVPDAAALGTVDAGAWGQLRGALAEAHGADDPWDHDPPRGSALGPLLAGAEARERDLDLAGALEAYAAACATQPGSGAPDWDRWERACEGAARMAYGLEDQPALDEALRRLLCWRPDHPLPAESFPPPVAARAHALAAELPRATLRIEGAAGAVQVDGAVRGQAPLRWAALPAGPHEVQCSGALLRFEAAPGETVRLRCPLPAAPGSARALLSSAADGEIHWVLVGDGAPEGMPAGTWVFHGAEAPVGLWIGPVPPASAIAAWEQRARAAAGD